MEIPNFQAEVTRRFLASSSHQDQKLTGMKPGFPAAGGQFALGLLFLFVFFLELPLLLKRHMFKNLK